MPVNNHLMPIEKLTQYQENNMIDRYTKVLLTVIAVNMTIMVGWGAVKVLVPEVLAQASVWIDGGRVDVRRIRDTVNVYCENCN